MINVSNEKSKVDSMARSADEIKTEIEKIRKSLSNLESSTSGNTLESYVSEMTNELSKIASSESLMSGDIQGIYRVINIIAEEERIEANSISAKKETEETAKVEESTKKGKEQTPYSSKPSMALKAYRSVRRNG